MGLFSRKWKRIYDIALVISLCTVDSNGTINDLEPQSLERSNIVTNGNIYSTITTTAVMSPKPNSQDCYQNLTDPEGNLTSPGFPQSYDPYKQCEWRINAGQGYTISLKVITFELHPRTYSFCRHGYLQFGTIDKEGFYTGSTTRRCGSMIPETVFKIQSGQCWVQFSGGEPVPENSSQFYRGFHIMYERSPIKKAVSTSGPDLTLLAMLLLLIPVLCPVVIYIYVKRLQTKALSEPEWKASKRFRRKHFHKRQFKSENPHDIQITVEHPSDEGDHGEDKPPEQVRPSGAYENMKQSEAAYGSSDDILSDISIENESVFKKEPADSDRVLKYQQDRTSLSMGNNKYLAIPCSTPFDVHNNVLYVSLLADSDEIRSGGQKRSRLKSRKTSQSIGHLLSTTSLRNEKGDPVLVLNQIYKSRKYGNLLSLGDAADVYKVVEKRRKSSTHGLKVRTPGKRTRKFKSEALTPGKRMSLPQNNRLEALKTATQMEYRDQLGRQTHSLPVAGDCKIKSANPDIPSGSRKSSKSSIEGIKFLKGNRERLPSKILSTIRRSRSNSPAVPEVDYSSEPLRDLHDMNHSVYYSARSQYDGHFFHEESPNNEEQLYVFASHSQRASPLHRCYSDRIVGIINKEGYRPSKNASLSYRRHRHGRMMGQEDRSLYGVREERVRGELSFQGLPRIQQENMSHSMHYLEGSTVLAGNIGVPETAISMDSYKWRENNSAKPIPEIKMLGVSSDNSFHGNDKESILESQLNVADVMEIDNPAFETSEIESPTEKIYNKEEIEEIYDSRSSMKKENVYTTIDENNNTKDSELDLSRTIPNDFCPNSVIVLQRGESMV